MCGMRQLFSQGDLRALSSILAVALFLANAPMSVGVVIIGGPSHPEFTVDICHPIQPLELEPGILLARPAPPVLESMLCDLGSLPAARSVRLVELHVAPDTPPPQLPV